MLAGCGGGSEGAGAVAPTPTDTRPAAASVRPNLPPLPGLPVNQVTDAGPVFKGEAQVVATRYGGPRADPFALKPAEKAFEIEQNTNRLLGTMGGFVVEYTPPVEKAPNEGLVPEPQPYRRLSGIIIGDSVYAIMDGEPGTPAAILRPGSKVPNTDWVVASIDADKAVLRRTGNKLPRVITVRLESPPPSMGGGAPAGGGPAGGGSPLGGGAPSGGKPKGGMGAAG